MEVKDLLKGAFGKDREKPQPDEHREHHRHEKAAPRYIQDPYSAVSAQRFFDPNYKAVAPPPKAPPQRYASEGVGPALGNDGSWGQPQALENK